jgi:NTE family protein
MADKTALVISGGGSKGAFAVGVIKFILEKRPQIKFDMISGTSTGSLITPLVATNNIALLEEIYTTKSTPDIVDTTRVFKRFKDGNNSIFDGTPLVNLAKQTYTQAIYDQIASGSIDIFINTVCLQTQQVTVFSNRDMPISNPDYTMIKIADRDELIRAIVASANQPFFMQPVEIRSTTAEPRQYVDGGLREYLSIQLAIDNGATEIFAIALSPESIPVDNTLKSNLIDILSLSVDIFSTDVSVTDIKIPSIYNKALTYIDDVKEKMKQNGISAQQIQEFFNIQHDNPFQNKRKLKIHIIRPQFKLDGGQGGLEFNPVKMKKMLLDGKQTAERYFQDLDNGEIIV